jgi:hypothetical protein
MGSKWTLGVVGVACVAMALSAGCRGPERADRADRDPSTSASAAEPVEILQQVRGDQSPLAQMGVRLVKTREQAADLGIDNIDGLAVDFDSQDLVILSLGEQPTGGFTAEITAIQLVGDELWVQGRVTQPGEEDMVTQALTSPFAAVVIRETPATRAFSEIE